MGIDKLRAIRYFVRTVEAGSFAAAARALDVSASALSKALAALEADLGFVLFNRSTRRLVLTDDGQAYSACCREVLQQLEDAELTARGGLFSARGTLRFGVHPALRIALLPRLEAFLRRHPQLKLDMVSTNAPTAVLDQGLDVVLCIGRLPDSGLVAVPLGEVEFLVCASPTYIAARGDLRHPHEIDAHDAIVYRMPDEESAVCWELHRNGERVVVTPLLRLAVRDGAGAIDAAIHGCGLVRPFDIAVRQALQTGQLRRVLPEWHSPRQSVHAVVPQARRMPAKVRAFIEFARELKLAPSADAGASSVGI